MLFVDVAVTEVVVVMRSHYQSLFETLKQQTPTTENPDLGSALLL